MKSYAASISAALLVSVLGCSSHQKASSGPAAADAPVNTICAVMYEDGHPVSTDGVGTVMYKGQRVGFCCEDCLTAWNAMSEAEKDKGLAAALAAK